MTVVVVLSVVDGGPDAPVVEVGYRLMGTTSLVAESPHPATNATNRRRGPVRILVARRRIVRRYVRSAPGRQGVARLMVHRVVHTRPSLT
jgi:hypothetical protein